MTALLNFFRSDHSQRAFAGVRAETRGDDILAVDLFRLVSEEPNFFYCSEIGQRAFTDVRLESRAEDILRILKIRRLEVTAEISERVRSCTDLDRLGTWLDRAVTASRAEELFADS
ncbi:hypothetical protein [Streptomyces iranensis]|uniref:hypothetical protein n=1 Tax=Streptomyces iranensis TaxID=576784 RepID=UPI0039B745DD